MLRIVSVVALMGSAAYGQQAISIRSGLLHHVEGKATLEGAPVNLRFGAFPIMHDATTLRTETGRAEVLLTPGVFFRLDENSSAKMINGKLSDTVVDLVSGAALVEVAGLEKEHKVTIRLQGVETVLQKQGLYRFDTDPARIRVYDGRAEVAHGTEWLPLTKGKEVVLGSMLVANKFSVKAFDDLYVWSQVRAANVAQANLSAARSLKTSGYRSNASIWAWSPVWGTLTYMPRSGYYHSYFGYYYYSPGAVWQTYPNGSYGGGGGYSNAGSSQPNWGGMGSSNGSYSGGGSVSSSVSSDAGRAAVSTSAPAVSSAGGRGR